MVAISSGSSERTPRCCPVCGKNVNVPFSAEPSFDVPCPECGSTLFFESGELRYAKTDEVASKIQWQDNTWVFLMPESVAREESVVPLWSFGSCLVIGMVEYELEVTEKLRFILNHEIQVVLLPPEEFDKICESFFRLMRRLKDDDESNST